MTADMLNDVGVVLPVYEKAFPGDKRLEKALKRKDAQSAKSLLDNWVSHRPVDDIIVEYRIRQARANAYAAVLAVWEYLKPEPNLALLSSRIRSATGNYNFGNETNVG